MKNINLFKVYLLFVICFWKPSAFAQLRPDQLQQFFLENKEQKFQEVTDLKTIQSFYELRKYKPAWIGKENSLHFQTLSNALASASEWGLDQKDYQPSLLSDLINNKISLIDIRDSAKTEILLTDAALHFFTDLQYGNLTPSFGYSGLKYRPENQKIFQALENFISGGSSSEFQEISSGIAETKILLKKIKWLTEILNRENFEEVLIISKKIEENFPLAQKLYQLGIVSVQAENFSSSELSQQIRETQVLFHLNPTGQLDKETMRELNIPLKTRLKQLNFAVNYYRWLSYFINQKVIVVNIPAAYLKVYSNRQSVLEMKMIVGKPSTPTYTLTSIVSEVIVYPYWHVPSSIATKELLPRIKRNPSFLEDNNYQVLNKSGKLVSPYSVNWNNVSRGYFPYTLRQSTGCDNALGLLKINFFNPFGAYLHDTPEKSLFKTRKRFYSHGCMRMEKPIDLGHMVLKNNQIAIDTLTEKGCLKNQSPILVPADERMPVVVWYNPVGIEGDNQLVFYEDIYKRFNWKAKN